MSCIVSKPSLLLTMHITKPQSISAAIRFYTPFNIDDGLWDRATVTIYIKTGLIRTTAFSWLPAASWEL